MIRRTVGKTALVTALIFACACCFLSVAPCAEAAGYSFDEGSSWLEAVGYDLGGYQASIEYGSVTKYISGLYYSFTITLDKHFLAQIGTLENNVYHVTPLFNYFKTLFELNGYTTEIDATNGEFKAHLDFETMTDYYIYTGQDGFSVSKSDAEVKKSFLYTDTHVHFPTPFASIENEGNLLNAVYTAIIDAGAQSDRIQLRFAYGTPYKAITSDADYQRYDAARKIYLHMFDMTMESKDREINLYQHMPNSGGWYGLAIILAIPIIAVPITVWILKKRKDKKKQID